jgi:hypothetical protein
MPRAAALKKEMHIAKSAAPAIVINVCDSNDQLGFNQDFTWSNTSNIDCTVTPSPNSVWPFTQSSYHVAAGKTTPGQTLPSPPLAKNQQPYEYLVTGGGCSADTVPKNVLIP